MNKNLENSLLLKFLILILIPVFCYSCLSGKNDREKGIYDSFYPGKIWYDEDSVHINAHGGGILFYDDTYYWFGEHKTSGRGGNTALVGVGVYSSKDLYNWKNEGIALEVVDEEGHDIEKGAVIERPKVIYNKNTDKFVMWFHLELKGQGYEAARAGVAVADQVCGPYEFIRSVRPNAEYWPLNYDEADKISYKNWDNKEWWTPEWMKEVEEGLFVNRDFYKGQMARDMTLFVDQDDKAYHIFASEENLSLHIAELTDDYLSHTGRYIRALPAGHREAPAIFYYDSLYYLITSGCTGWRPNAADIAVADNIFGPWKQLGSPCIGENAEITFEAQSTFVLPIHNRNNAFIFMADRWKPRNPIDGRYIWLPIHFEDGSPIIKWYDQWDLSVFYN